jgi:hypothetical protein
MRNEQLRVESISENKQKGNCYENKKKTKYYTINMSVNHDFFC